MVCTVKLKSLLGSWSRRYFVHWYVGRSLDTPGTVGLQSLMPLLGPHPKIIEVGAHVGTDTQKFAAAFPRGHIYAFEPHPKLFCQACHTCSRYSNVTLIPVALSDSSGFQTFRQSSGSSDGSGSLLKPTGVLTRYPTVLFQPEDAVVVATGTLDEYLEICEVPNVDLIWIDAQGAEGAIFEGATRTLANTRYVYCEVSTFPEYEGASTYSQVQILLARFGLTPIREFMPSEWHGSGNVLFGRLTVEPLNL